MACLLTTITRQEQLRSLAAFCKQTGVYLLVSSDQDPQSVKGVNLIDRLPAQLFPQLQSPVPPPAPEDAQSPRAAEPNVLLYADDGEPQYLSSEAQFVALARRYA